MKTENRRELREAGVNLEKGTARFVGNEFLFLAYLKKFPDETSYSRMTEELSHKNYEEAFKAAYNLKRLTENLAIESLNKKVTPLVEAIHREKLEEAEALYRAVKESYDKVVEILKRF